MQYRLKIGQAMPDFTFDTPFAKEQKLSNLVGMGKTAIIFLRYYGCTICQYEMHQLSKNYDSITSSGGKLMVVLQSTPENIASEITPDTFPFTIICDPEQALYKQFNIQPASSTIRMANASTIAKMGKAVIAGYKHGKYEGNELQLPAAFVVDANLTITQAYYGKAAGDTPSIETLTQWLK